MIYPENILKAMDKKDRKALGKAGRTKEEVIQFVEAKNERELQSQIAAMLRLHDIAFCQPRTDKRSTMTVGWPDFTLAINGIPIALECKSDVGKVSPEQQKCHDNMRRNGWNVFIIRHLSEVVSILKITPLLKSISCKY